MKVSTTADRLRQLMRERGLKQVDILEKAKPYAGRYGTKLTKTDLSQYVAGKVEPRQDKLTVLGMALAVPEAWLMGYDVPIEHADTPQHAVEDLKDDPLANQLFAAYGEVKKEFDAEDIEDIKMFMEMVAERKKKRREREEQ